MTTVFSSLIGLFQQDIKKVIAYSTMSQLGMMIIAVGLSSYNIALFHLVNHAFYKGLLFLGSGFFIDNSIYIHPLHEIMLNTEFAVPIFFKLLPLIFTIIFSFLAIILSEFLPKLFIYFKFTRLGYNLFGFFNQRFLIEFFYNKYITNLILDLGSQTTKIIDKC